MTKGKRNLISKVNLKLSQSQVNRLITISIILVVVASILGISSSVFLQKTSDGFSELSLLMYNSLTETYEANNYPENIVSTANVSIYFMVKNFENITPEPLIKELKGLFKFRIGDWRIVYSLEEDDTIVIQYIGHRSQIYKRIKH